ncbi:MAG: di-heme oxidoredictase family protein [Methylacidiphilales bacterium]|nr:di-heme oxidoredictase family protein [Candidatus Methylacidiphilales bacterium]
MFLNTNLNVVTVVLFVFIKVLSIESSLASSDDIPQSLADNATTQLQGRDSFAMPLATLPSALLNSFYGGHRLFNVQWLPSGSIPKSLSGLGPLFNRSSCSGCHSNNGRGAILLDGNNQLISSLVRITTSDARYGSQLRTFAIDPVQPDVSITIVPKYLSSFQDIDGKKIQLQQFILHFSNWSKGIPPSSSQYSLRVAPAVIGLGLLAAIPDKEIIDNMKSQETTKGPVKGKINYISHGVIGRFGWKANTSTLIEQVAAASFFDIGLTNKIHSDINQPNELQDKQLNQLVDYMEGITVPSAPLVTSRQAKDGYQLFVKIGCAGCHRPSYQTKSDKSYLDGLKIFPFTDLLVHDLGDGLADGRSDGFANGNQWRTAPLWGIGKIKFINNHTNYLHDGRARNLLEAILWHQGEAKQVTEIFSKLSKEQRDRIIYFLESL